MAAEGLRLRFRVWRDRARLDAALADGADPATDHALAMRARQLTAAASRNALANTILNVLDAADEPAQAWPHGGPHPPLQTDAITAARDRLEALAQQLQRQPVISAQSAALASLLLWDSASPLYSARSDASIDAWAQALDDTLAARTPSLSL